MGRAAYHLDFTYLSVLFVNTRLSMSKLHIRIWNKIRGWIREFWYFISSTYFLKNFGKILGLGVLLFLLLTWGLKCYTRHGDSVKVGNYIGKNIADVEQQLKKDDFRMIITDSTFLLDKKPGVILKQTPKPNALVKENRTIYLTITKQNPDEKALPGLVGNYDYDVYKKKLKRLGMRSKIKRQVFDNKSEPGTILYFFHDDKKITENDLKKGVKIPMGTMLEFVITTREGGRIQVPQVTCMTFKEAAFIINNSGLKVGKVIEDSTVTDRTNAFVRSQFPVKSSIGLNGSVELKLTQQKPDGC